MIPGRRTVRGLRLARIALTLMAWVLVVGSGSSTSVADESNDLHHRAEQEFLAGDLDEAVSSYSRILVLSPEDSRAMDGRIRALLARDDWSLALDDARRYLSSRPDDPLCISALGETLLRAGRFDEAKELLDPIVALDTPPARGLMTLSRLHAALGNRAEAQGLMDRAVALSPDDRELLLHASEVAPARSKAIEHLERFLELSDGFDPDRITAARETLRLLRELGDRKIWVRKSRPERVEVPLKRLIDPSTRRRLGYVVQARLQEGGKPVRLLLDTGANGLHVVERVARKNKAESPAGAARGRS